MRVCIAETVVPFAHGGAELLVAGMVGALEERGVEVERLRLPFSWWSREELVQSALAWRLLEIRDGLGEEIDAVIATRFPSYLVQHPNKVVWLIHQFRQAYDLDGTRFGFLSGSPEDRRVVELVHAMDKRGLGEARRLFAISANTAGRLERFNGLTAETLYPPPPLDGRYREGPGGNFVLSVGRLEPIKRVDLLIRAVAQSQSARAVIVGDGPEAAKLTTLAAELDVADRVELRGRVDDDGLLELYSGCGCIYYAPFDEDYGYVTLEAFRSAKPVVTAADAGGVLELVEDGATGLVAPAPDADHIATRLDLLLDDPGLARRLGQEGRRRIAHITWDNVIERLIATHGV